MKMEKQGNILIVVPRESTGNEAFYNYFFPIGIAYVSAVLKKANYKVDCLNLNHFSGEIEDILKENIRKEYKYVCSGGMIVSFNCLEKIIKWVKKNTKSKFILGGAITASETEVIFNSLKPDYAIVGEGEITIIELIDALENNKNLNKVKGIAYYNKKLIQTELREPIKNLDSLPFPDMEGIGIKEVLDNISCNRWWKSYFDYPRTYEMLTGRGCPFNCTFCFHYSRFRKRSLDNVFEELGERVKKYNINLIRFHDECLTLDKEKLFEFCRRIRKLSEEVGRKLRWICQSRVTITREIIKEMKKAGCIGISFGFESANNEVLKSMNKGITKEDIENIIKICFEEKMGFTASFIFGDIAETLDTARETLEFNKKYLSQARLGLIIPCPVSKIWQYCLDKGIIKDKEEYFRNFNFETISLNFTNMEDKEFEEMKNLIFKYRRYYAYSVPISKTHIKNKIYSLKVECPYCKEETEYKNCRLDKKYDYGFDMICRKCFKKFYIVSCLKRLGYYFYSNRIRKLRDLYLKVKERK